MRSIIYTKRDPIATDKTRRFRISKEDTRFLLDLAETILQATTLCEQYKDTKVLAVKMHAQTKSLPKKANGELNSSVSFLQGVLHNFKNSQKDPSEKTAKGLTYAINLAHQLYNTEEIEFITIGQESKQPTRSTYLEIFG